MKTKYGVSVGLVGAALYFAGLSSGLLLLVVMATAVLLTEENEWLKKTAVKAVVLYLFFNVIGLVIGLIPGAFNVIDSFVGIFGGSFNIAFISRIVSFIATALSYIQKILTLLLGFSALYQSDMKFGPVDKLVDDAFKKAE